MSIKERIQEAEAFGGEELKSVIKYIFEKAKGNIKDITELINEIAYRAQIWEFEDYYFYNLYCKIYRDIQDYIIHNFKRNEIKYFVLNAHSL